MYSSRIDGRRIGCVAGQGPSLQMSIRKALGWQFEMYSLWIKYVPYRVCWVIYMAVVVLVEVDTVPTIVKHE